MEGILNPTQSSDPGSRREVYNSTKSPNHSVGPSLPLSILALVNLSNPGFFLKDAFTLTQEHYVT